MARVPLEGSINMFDGVSGVNATSIYEVVKYEVGTPVNKNFDAILTLVRANASIEDFHPFYGPDTLVELSETRHFRGFPFTGSVMTWFMQQAIEEYHQI